MDLTATVLKEEYHRRMLDLYTNYQALGLNALRSEACQIYKDINFGEDEDFSDPEDYFNMAEAMTSAVVWESENGYCRMDLYFEE